MGRFGHAVTLYERICIAVQARLLIALVAGVVAGGAIRVRADDLLDVVLRSAGTNNSAGFNVRSALLLSPTNAGPQLTNPIISSYLLAPDDELLGLRIGMTMEEVIERWGKPQAIYVPCTQSPCLNYQDAHVIFNPTTRGVEEVWVRKAPPFNESPTPLKDFEGCVRILGEPDERKITPDPFSEEGLMVIPQPGRSRRAPFFFCDATYLGKAAKKIIAFQNGELVSVTLVKNNARGDGQRK